MGQFLSYPSAASLHVSAVIAFPVVFLKLAVSRAKSCYCLWKEGRQEKSANIKCPPLKGLRGKEVFCMLGWEVDENMSTSLIRSYSLRFSDVGGWRVSNHNHMGWRATTELATYCAGLLLGHLTYLWLGNDPAGHMAATWQEAVLLSPCCKMEPVCADIRCIWVRVWAQTCTQNEIQTCRVLCSAPER